MDCHWGGDSPPRGYRHHFHPVLETVSDRQAGVPARRHDLHPAETEGRVRPVFQSHFKVHSLNVIFEIYKLTVIGTTVTFFIKKKINFTNILWKDRNSLTSWEINSISNCL